METARCHPQGNITPTNQRGRQGGFSDSGTPEKDDAAIVHLDGAAVQRQDAALVQQGAEGRSQEKQTNVLVAGSDMPFNDNLVSVANQKPSDPIHVEQQLPRNRLITNTNVLRLATPAARCRKPRGVATPEPGSNSGQRMQDEMVRPKALNVLALLEPLFVASDISTPGRGLEQDSGTLGLARQPVGT